MYVTYFLLRGHGQHHPLYALQQRGIGAEGGGRGDEGSHSCLHGCPPLLLPRGKEHVPVLHAIPLCLQAHTLHHGTNPPLPQGPWVHVHPIPIGPDV